MMGKLGREGVKTGFVAELRCGSGPQSERAVLDGMGLVASKASVSVATPHTTSLTLPADGERPLRLVEPWLAVS